MFSLQKPNNFTNKIDERYLKIVFSDTRSIFKEFVQFNERMFNQKNIKIVTTQVYKLVNDI